jgi:hypothetical protein
VRVSPRDSAQLCSREGVLPAHNAESHPTRRCNRLRFTPARLVLTTCDQAERRERLPEPEPNGYRCHRRRGDAERFHPLESMRVIVLVRMASSGWSPTAGQKGWSCGWLMGASFLTHDAIQADFTPPRYDRRHRDRTR